MTLPPQQNQQNQQNQEDTQKEREARAIKANQASAIIDENYNEARIHRTPNRTNFKE